MKEMVYQAKQGKKKYKKIKQGSKTLNFGTSKPGGLITPPRWIRTCII